MSAFERAHTLTRALTRRTVAIYLSIFLPNRKMINMRTETIALLFLLPVCLTLARKTCTPVTLVVVEVLALTLVKLRFLRSPELGVTDRTAFPDFRSRPYDFNYSFHFLRLSE